MTEVFDRSRFKGAKLSTLKETKEKADEKNVRLLGGSSTGRANFLEVKEGRNIFRIMPPHNPEDSTYQPFRSATLECDVPEMKDGKETGKTEKKNKKIFIATVHGNDEVKALKKDPIELYIKYVSDMAGACQDKDERQKFLAPVTGYRDKAGKWVWGIMPSTSYICYALEGGKLGRLELWDKWTKDMDKIVAKIEEEEDQPLEIDPFSNPEEGYPLIIDKEKNDKNKFEHVIDRLTQKKRQTWEDFCNEHKITDDQLKELMEKESLKDLYVGVYSKRDFDLAVNGLRSFDKRYKYDVFENDEFIKELKEIEAVVPEPKKDANGTKDIEEAFDKGKKSSDVKDWTKRKCKEYLKAYILDNHDSDADTYLDAIEELDIDELQSWCVLAESGKKLPKVDEAKEDVKAPEGTESEESTEDDELEKLTAGRRRRS